MKTQEEIEQLAFLKYPYEGGIETNVTDDLRQGFIKGYSQSQEDMTNKKLDVDDINEMALDYIINTGCLPDSVEALQYCLHKFYQSLNKQD